MRSWRIGPAWFGLVTLLVATAAHGYSAARAARAYNSMMQAERASTQAIRDSVRLVNRQPLYTTPATLTSQSAPEPDPATRAREDMARLVQYERMQEQQQVQLLRDLADRGYVPALSELGRAYLNAELGLRASAADALRYLVPAAAAGDATAAFNAGVAHQRLGDDAPAIPYFEQAARSGVPGASYKLSMAALFARDFDRAIDAGRQAAREKSALGAYAACLAAQFQDKADIQAEFCPLAVDLGHADAAEDAGTSLANQGHWDRAYPYLRRCAERAGETSCQRNAGLAAFKLNQWPEAERWMDQSEAAGDNNEDAQMMLALIAIYGKPQQWDKADRMLRAVLAHAGPRAAEAHFNLALVYQERPDRSYSDDEINAEMVAAARGGHEEARKMLQEHGIPWQ